jgi:hypothetical protein
MSELIVIGKIAEVRGLSVRAVLFSTLPPYIVRNGKKEVAPRINGFVKTMVGLDVIVCQIIGEISTPKEEGKGENYSLELRVCGYLEKGHFIQGLRMLPIVDANLYLFDPSDYLSLFQLEKCERPLPLGNDLFDDSKQVCADPDKLLLSHIGVFGNTGSGKSNTLAKLLSGYADLIREKHSNRAKFLVLDFNNEYGGESLCPADEKTVYCLSTRKNRVGDKIPLDVASLKEDDFLALLQASEKTQAPVVKSAYRRFRTDLTEKDKEARDDRYTKIIRRMICAKKKDLVFSIRFYLSKYLIGMETLAFHSSSESFYVLDVSGNRSFFNGNENDPMLSSIFVKTPEDDLDLFFFELFFSISFEEDNGTNYQFLSPLIARAGRLFEDFKKIFDFSGHFALLFKKKNICVVQMGNINLDMQSTVPSLLGNIIFERMASKKRDNLIPQAVSIVIDEAHRILNEDNSLPSVLSTYEKIVKEGRKFGLFLMVASQRPSDISATIISQLHNYFIHKLVNPQDIERIRKAVAYMDEKALDLMTILAPGECIVSGTAFQMPSFIYVQRAPTLRCPQSDNVALLNGPNALLKQKPLEKDSLADDEE